MSRSRTFDWGDYDHFRAFGWDHDRIAARLGVDPASLQTALARRAARHGKNAEQPRGVERYGVVWSGPTPDHSLQRERSR